MKKESLEILDKLIQNKIRQIESFECLNESIEAGKMAISLSSIAQFELLDLEEIKDLEK